MNEPKHHSATQINMFMRCGFAYYCRYILGEKSPPVAAMIQGGSVHKGLELNYQQKVNTRVDLPLDTVLDAYVSDFDRRIVEVEERVNKGELKDQGVDLVTVYQHDVARNLQPINVEEKVTIEFDNVPYTI
ncbi:MAG: PD-(D/E)XK nuclease family protein, partial [Candidatus Krumholzibacteriota bacterium]|nr:PD-(D/E)XK nuclease family protein [Candidatus Krumholzibacteriota bacterium]